MKFQVFYRTSKIFGKNPINGVDPFITLKSLLKSFTPEEIIIICDNTTEEQYLNFAKQFPIVYKTCLGNSGSFQLSIKLTKIHKGEIYYFVEDDHLHLPEQKTWIKAGLKLFDFISLYDHPDKYFLEMYKKLKRTIKITPLGYFTSTPSTVMTFACLASTLENSKEILLHEKLTGETLKQPNDYNLFKVLKNHGYTLGTPIPGRSTHCEENLLSPFVNWDQYIKELKKEI